MEIDIKKIMGECPKDQFEASAKMIKAQQEILEALHIMQSTIDFFDEPECLDYNKERMKIFLNKYCK